MKRFPNPFNIVRTITWALWLFFIPSLALAAWYNPLSWGSSLSSFFSDGGWSIVAIALGWLVKRTVDSYKLKAAMVSIKDAVDSVRMANDNNSPGGSKVTIGEAVGIAEKSFTSILSTLRLVNPAWLPHWVATPEEGDI